MAIGPGRLILLCKGGTNINEKKLKVLVVEPMELPVVREIGGSLEDMQRVVGGDIQAVYPFDPERLLLKEMLISAMRKENFWTSP